MCQNWSNPRLVTSCRNSEGTSASFEAARRTRRKMARAESRWSDEEVRWASSRLMSLGVRREVMLSRWDIRVTKLRTESLQLLAKRTPLCDRLGVVERPCEDFADRQVLSRGRRRAWASRAISHGRSNRRLVVQGCPAVEDRQSPGG